MTPDEAARALRCWVCSGPLSAQARKPWYFRCASCMLTIRPGDIGQLQQAIMRRAGRPAEGTMADG